jgi:glycosyltransferase involved in cell wall biosynthesis
MTASAELSAGSPREVVLIAGKDPLLEIGGGHSAYVRAHARAAIRGGMNPHLFCVSDRLGIVETDFGTVHRVKSLVPMRFRAGMGSPHYMPLLVIHGPQLARAISRFLRHRPGPHVVHGFGPWAYAGLAVRKRLARHGVAAATIASVYTTIWHESCAIVAGLGPSHGLDIKARALLMHFWVTRVVERLERRALAETQLLLVNYESVRTLLPPARRDPPICRLVPYSSESAFFREGTETPPCPASLERPDPTGVPTIVSVSRHDPRKGVDVLIHALAILKSMGVSFRACLVGGGSLLEENRRLARRLGICDVATVEGFVEDVWPYLRHAGVFVLPSLEEGSGSLSLIEALQAGAAVVASRCDGIPEDVENGESALLVPPGDREALAKALARLLRDPELRATLSRGARRTFERRFRADGFSRALAATYRSAVPGAAS